MVLRPDTDPITGRLRLVGEDIPEDVTFFENELAVFPLGVFMRGGNDTVRGSEDSEPIRGNAGDDRLFGNGGNDFLSGGQGSDYLEGNDGSDEILGELDPDTLFGGPGADTLSGGTGFDLIEGEAGNDVIFGGQDGDSLTGGEGSDRISGDGGADDLIGGADDDTLFGGTEGDQIRGDEGNDLIYGEAGDDFLTGGDGDDEMFGGRGNDRILGEAGNDRLSGNLGSDSLAGGVGNDTFFIQAGSGVTTIAQADQIFDFTPGEDTIFLLGDAPIDGLNIVEEPDNANNTIFETEGGEILAVVRNVRPSQIARSDLFVPGVLSFESPRFEIQENGSGEPVTVVRSGGEDGAVGVTVVPASTAPLPPDGVDLNPVTVNFDSGELGPKPVPIRIADDSLVEYPETLQLSLEDPTGTAVVVEPATAIVEIVPDEEPRDPVRTFDNPSPEAFSRFGVALETAGTQVYVGTPGWNGSQGLVYLFDVPTGQPLQTFNNPSSSAGNSQFGTSIATWGGNPVVGAPADSSLAPATGAVYLYNPVTGGAIAQFLNPTPEPFDNFGYSVAAFGNTVAVGAPTDGTSGVRSGTAYLFDATTGALLQTFNNPDPQPDDSFGAAIAMVGDWVLVGAPGSLTAGGSNRPGEAYIFNGATGELIQSFRNPNPGPDRFGHAVAWTGIGRDILIGAPGDDRRGVDAGAAFLIDGITGAIFEDYSPPQLRSGNRFGTSLDMTGNSRVLVGAPGFGPFDYGAAFQFQLRTGQFLDTYLHPNPSPGDGVLGFGAAVAGFGTGAIVGSPDTDVGLESVGTVYQFEGF